MTIYFSISSGAMLELSRRPIDEAIRTVERLSKIWIRFGVLVYGRQSSDFIASVNRLPTTVRKKWQVLLKRCRKTELGDDLADIHDCHCSEDLERFIQTIELYLIDSDSCSSFSVPAQASSVLLDGANVEICRVDSCDVSKAISRAEQIWDSGVGKGDGSHEVWDKFLSGYPRHAKFGSIVDRYSLINLIDDSRGGTDTGLSRLLRWIYEENPSLQLKVFAASHESYPDLDLFEALESTISEPTFPPVTGAITVIIRHGLVFKDFGHERHLRFDNHVVNFGTGSEVVSGASNRRFSYAGLSVRGKYLREQIETPLEKARGFDARVKI